MHRFCWVDRHAAGCGLIRHAGARLGLGLYVQGTSDPVKVFDRAANLEQTQIISYRVDPSEKWCVACCT